MVQPENMTHKRLSSAGPERRREFHAGKLTRPLTATQAAAVHRAMRVFVDDDLSRGISPLMLSYCAACEGLRPRPGFIAYDGYALCNQCAIDYEMARMSGGVNTIESYLRTRRPRAA
jgi:hypothetical protein